MTRAATRPRSRQRGLSIVEVLVSLVIGLVVVGAVLLAYLTSGQTQRLQTAYAQMNEDAQIGLHLLSSDLLLAGYAQPVSLDPGTLQLVRTYAGRPVFGCDGNFVKANTTGQVICAGNGNSHSIEVVYEADLATTVRNSTSKGPSDCLGGSLAEQTVGSTNFFVAYNRYYVATSVLGRPELHCASNKAGAVGLPLVDNVESMKIWYGEANPAEPRSITRYVSAANVKDLGTDFSFVVSVRVCLLMRSAEPVLTAEDSASYLDCDSTLQTSTDRFARRAYARTTALRNKMAF
ncbi:PilW family protein [Polaromonas sp.]|uniref:PilW family protein n=1 Tax=Polaromonas sp. TaxID=1869339 RepID=UPI003266D345